MEGIWLWSAIFYLILSAFFANTCYILADAKKYRNASSYAWLGFFFGLIVLIYVAGLPDLFFREQVAEIKANMDSISSTRNGTNFHSSID